MRWCGGEDVYGGWRRPETETEEMDEMPPSHFNTSSLLI